MKLDITTIPAELLHIKEQKGYKVVKYRNKVFFKNLWTPLLQECRGLILDQEDNIVAWPFTKVFNIGENGTTFPALPYELVEKKNGFLGVVSIGTDGELLFSTTGSLESEFVDMWRDYFYKHTTPEGVRDLMMGLMGESVISVMFEVCHPNDPHIVKEDHGIYLIGARYITGNMADEAVLDLLAKSQGTWKRPEHFMCRSQEQVDELLKNCQHEGFMIRDVDGNIVAKYKSKNYLRRKLLARCSATKIAQLYDMDIEELFKVGLEEEFIHIVAELRNRYSAEQWASMSQVDRLNVLDNLV